MDDFLSTRRVRVVAALPLGEAVLVVGAGGPVPLPEGSDQHYPFRAHAEYYYLAGQECAGGVVAFDPREHRSRPGPGGGGPDHDRPGEGGPDRHRLGEGGWHSFVPVVTEGELVWEGKTQMPGRPVGELDPWLAARRDRPVVMLGAPLTGVAHDVALTASVRDAFTHARRPKDAHEIALLRRAAHVTAGGFARVQAAIRPGVTERALQIELEAEFLRQGGTRPGYGTIIGSGPNSAVLHFEPSARVVREGEFVLIDAGAEIDRYTADVTRTYVAGTPTAFQRDLYQVVLAAEERALARCVAGAEWKNIHLAAALDLVSGLVDLGIMRGAAAALVEQEAHALFFPHGIGHMVGLGVRDGSGLLPGREKDPRPCLRSLRMDLPLAPGYMVTIEPGLYFIPALLNHAARRAQFRDCVNWPLVDQHLGLGGVRIEDNVLVTGGPPEVLTAAITKKI